MTNPTDPADGHTLLSILSDQPAVRDRLNFTPYAKTLAEIIADRGTHTPLTIGVFGGWGQGKTSLMRMVERMLEETLRSTLRTGFCGGLGTEPPSSQMNSKHLSTPVAAIPQPGGSAGDR